MIDPAVLIWIEVVTILLLLLLVLIEIHRSEKRRESEEMFGSQSFESKKKLLCLTEKEMHTIEKIVRQSSFSNKDAVFNSSILFEEAVNRFYEFRKINQIRTETLQSVSSLREKLGFTVYHKNCILTSSRQFVTGIKVTLLSNSKSDKEHTEVIAVDEKSWKVKFSGIWGENFYPSLEGSIISMRWTQPDEAVYSGKVKVLKVSSNELELSHIVDFEKLQLRRWIREQVLIPVQAFISHSSKLKGFLFDLSAGGILIGLPISEIPTRDIEIQFSLPSFGSDRVKIEILRKLSKKRQEYPDLYLYTASFSGEFGRIQEKVLQYIFQVHKKKKT